MLVLVPSRVKRFLLDATRYYREPRDRPCEAKHCFCLYQSVSYRRSDMDLKASLVKPFEPSLLFLEEPPFLEGTAMLVLVPSEVKRFLLNVALFGQPQDRPLFALET